jgi:hypothetical protein
MLLFRGALISPPPPLSARSVALPLLDFVSESESAMLRSPSEFKDLSIAATN